MMLITVPIQLEVGKVYDEKSSVCKTFEVYGVVYKKFKFLVLGIKTYNDYIEYLKKNYPDDDLSIFVIQEYFYEISMD